MSDENQEGFCGKCGAKNPLKSTFCFKCGEKLLWASEETLTPPDLAEKPAPRTPEPKTEFVPIPPPIRVISPRKGIWMMTGLLAAAFALAMYANSQVKNEPIAESPRAEIIAKQKQAAAEAAKKPKPTATQLKAQKVAQEARKKQVEQERKQAEIAQEKAEEKQRKVSQQKDDKFNGVLKVVNMQYGLDLVRNAGTKNNGRTIIIKVDNAWHSMNKQVRLQNTQFIGDAWGSIHDEVENPRISIQDNYGNEVGGFNSWNGFWVQD